MNPVTSSQATVEVAPLRRRPLAFRIMCTRLINQSPVRVCSIPKSSTTTGSPPSTKAIDRSSKSPKTSNSPARDSKRRILTRPVITTAPDSMEVTRVIGTKTRRRKGTSTTRPRMRAGWLFERSVATASRTFPTGSPFGSKTAVPARRAINTRLITLALIFGLPSLPKSIGYGYIYVAAFI